MWLIVCLFVTQTAFAPANAFTIGEEREVGEKLLYSIRSSFELIDDPDITQYMTQLGNSVLKVAGIQYFDYHFFLVNSKDFNAFAAPSGLLFFYSGLVSMMNSENEFVSVIAHEIGHIVKRHLASQVEKGTYSTLGSLGLAVAAIAFGGTLAPVLLTGAIAAGQSVTLHFSRKNEEEADFLAYGWMKELHRDPKGQAEMLETMRRIARYRSEQLPQYLTTHPNPEARLDYIESLLAIDRGTPEPVSGIIDDFDFLRFKYRVLTRVKEPNTLRLYFNRILENQESSKLRKTMAVYGLSQLALRENDYHQSLTRLEVVMAELPEKSILRTDRGVILFEAGELVKAEASLAEALRTNSSDMYAVLYMGRLLYKNGDLEGARKLFLKLSYNQPEYSKVYFELGQIASDLKENGMSNFYLGKYYLFEGKFDLAMANFSLALSSKTLPEKIQEEGKELLEKAKKMKK